MPRRDNRDNQQAILKKLAEARVSENVAKLKDAFLKAKRNAINKLPQETMKTLSSKFKDIVGPLGPPISIADIANIANKFDLHAQGDSWKLETTPALQNLTSKVQDEMLIAVNDEIAAIHAALDAIKNAPDIHQATDALIECREACEELAKALTFES